MLKINKQVTTPSFKRNVESNTTSTTVTENRSVETSYENKDANLAITNNNKILIKEKFIPAKTKEELEEQINNTKWLSEENKEKVKPVKKYFKEECDIIAFSTFWKSLDELSPILQEKIDLQKTIRKVYSEEGIANITKFSVQEANKLSEDIKKNIPNETFLPLINNAELINKLYNTINDKEAKYFSLYNIYNKKDTELKEYINKTLSYNSLDKEIAKKIPAKTVILSNKLPSQQIKKQIDYLNKLSSKEKCNLSTSYLNKIFKDDYSYALQYDDYEYICGTNNFTPFNKKEQLKKELACIKNQKNEWVFDNDEIEKIINSENDIYELSKILNELKKQKNEFVYSLLSKEGISLKRIKPGLSLIEEIQKDPEYEDIKDSIQRNSNIFYLKKKEAENFKKNLPILNILKKYNLEKYKKDVTTYFPDYIITGLSKKEINKEKLENLLNQNILKEPPDIFDIIYLINSTNINDIKQENIDFLNDLKTNEYTKEIFKNQFSIYEICEILNFDLPKNFKLANQTEMINLIKYIESDEKKAKALEEQYIEILTKNDSYEDGVKLIDYILKNNIDDLLYLEGRITKNSFKDTLKILKRIQSSSLTSDNSCLDKYSTTKIEKVLDLIDYAEQKNMFDNINLSITDIIKTKDMAKEYNIKSISDEDIKKEIDKISILSKTIEPQIWIKIKKSVLESILIGIKEDFPIFKKENIEYLNKFMTDERNKTKESTWEELYIDILTSDLNINTLNSNYEDKMNLGYTDNKYITYLGDIKKLDSLIKELKQKGLQIYVDVASNKEDVTIQIQNEIYRYDKNINLISKSKGKQKINKNNDLQTIIETIDYKKNTKTTIIQEKDPKYEKTKPQKIKISFLNKDGETLKTREYNNSSIGGAFNVKEYSQNGEVKNICTATKDNGIETIKKDFESADGTKSNILYTKDEEGNEKYTYKITDKDGNLLLDLERKTQIIDNETKITTVNGKEYKIKYSEDDIKVTDTSTKKETILNLDELNPESNLEIKELLKSLPGDELIDIKEYLTSIKLTNKIESCINPQTKIMEVGPSQFIFEHELGHGKDKYLENNIRKISNNRNVQEIFMEERNNYINKFPQEINELTSYFTNKIDHYGGEWGGLSETIAETNAIQTTGDFHPFLKDRSQFLQENFPKTIAYLINNHL